jgi:PTH1 family peptidyl-tRNA hydrolase
VKLVVGLGNPGRKYARTRHNIGFLIVDRVGTTKDVVIKTKLCNALVGEWSSDGEAIVLAKPQTFMNRSGETVKRLLREFHSSTKDMIVVYDDLDLPFGRIRIRRGGSAGGHRGVASVMEGLGDSGFSRVRVGIGRPPEGEDAVDYVLEPFSPQEAAELGDVVTRASEAIISLIRDGIEHAMAQFNRTP